MENMIGLTLDQQNALFNQIISQVTSAIDSGNFSGLSGVGVDPSLLVVKLLLQKPKQVNIQ